MSENFQDRRKYVRVYRNFVLSYYEKDKKDIKYDISQVNNISKGGINFIAVRAFDPGVILSIELRTPFISDVVYLEGKVLESKEKISNLIFEIRLEFHELSQESLNILDKIERYNIKESEG
jgi:hypothetical protein